MSSLFRIARNSQLLRSMFFEASSDLTLLRGMSFKAGVSAAFPGSTEATIPTAYSRVRPDGNPGIKIYAPYTVYKGKAALAAEMILPKFNRLKSGSYRLERSGGVMLTLWPAIGERKYNWEKRQLFSLSATEVGSLISLGSKESCEFLHDPAMKSSNAGQIRKTLSIKAHDDGSGYFITLGVMNNVLRTNDRLTVPVSTAEFAVLRSACTFALPHLLGWDKHSNQLPSSNSESSYRSAAPAIPSLEWDR